MVLSTAVAGRRHNDSLSYPHAPKTDGTDGADFASHESAAYPPEMNFYLAKAIASLHVYSTSAQRPS